MAEDWSDDLKESLKELTIGFPEETKEKLYSGAYGEGVVVKVQGLRCAGIKIDMTIASHEQDSARERFVQKCLQLSRLRHSNIVQFFGVRFAHSKAPTLVMELLPLSLSECLEKYVEIPAHTKNSILLDVALGLRYLHEQIPPIIHRLLSTNCILLTCGLQAKIAVGSTETAISTFMAPEEIETRDAKGDVFGFGNLIIHVTLQKIPEPLEAKVHPNPENPDETISVSEVHRREKFLSEMDDSSPLQDLAKKCLEDIPAKRPSAAEMTEQLKKINDAKPPPYDDTLEMYQAIGKLAFAKENVDGLTRTIQAKEEELEAQKMQLEALKQEIEAKELVISTQQQELQTYMQGVHVKNERIKANDQAIRAKDALIKAKGREIAAKKTEVAAKESLLKAANKRIEQLEQLHPSKKGVGMERPGVSPRKRRESPANLLRPNWSANTESESPSSKTTDDMGGVVLRKTRGRRSNTMHIVSDGFVYQNWSLQKSKSVDHEDSASRKVDPKLASLLARQQRKIEENEAIQELESIQERKDENIPDPTKDHEKTSSSQQQSKGGEPLPELQKLEKPSEVELNVPEENGTQ